MKKEEEGGSRWRQEEGETKKKEEAEDTYDTGIIDFSPTCPVAGRF